MKTTITAEQLRTILHYDAQTGILTWQAPPHPRFKAGKEAGTVHGGTHRRIHLGGRFYLSHRLAWLYMTGEWPLSDIDHADLNGLNNKWRNLRLATESQNGANAKIRKHNTTGFKGVSFHKRDKKFIASIRLKKRLIHLGSCDTAEDAAQLYTIAALKYYGEFARAPAMADMKARAAKQTEVTP